MPHTPRVVVVGAGIGGLAAALDLAGRGVDVIVVERGPAAGGKLRELRVDGAAIDAGPTVFTMRWVFESLFEAAGTSLDSQLELVPAAVLARHAWRDGSRLDLFADVAHSAQAIGEFAGAAEARGYLEFCRRSARIYRTLQDSFITRPRPSLPELVRRVGLARLGSLWALQPMQSLWSALGAHFSDPRLRQLFGRYATYCGSSPFAAPATLMLVAHVEQDGVWLVRGGMQRVAEALRRVGEAQGARFRFGCEARQVLLERGRACGVRLQDGERLAADAVIFNGEVSALEAGLLGAALRHAAPTTAPAARSLSALTWCLNATTRGFDLEHHNVFFAADYAHEFDALFRQRRIAAAPTVYVCAQDRGAAALRRAPADRERLLVLVNAPADGDRRGFDRDWTAAREREAFALLQDCGLQVAGDAARVATTPADFERLFPASGGALYGPASVGALSSFRRNGSRTGVPGLFLAGGSVHPGPGLPMAAMSGRLAAAAVLQSITARVAASAQFAGVGHDPV